MKPFSKLFQLSKLIGIHQSFLSPQIENNTDIKKCDNLIEFLTNQSKIKMLMRISQETGIMNMNQKLVNDSKFRNSLQKLMVTDDYL